MHQHLVDDDLEEQRRDEAEQLQEERRDSTSLEQMPIFVDRPINQVMSKRRDQVGQGRPAASSGRGGHPRPLQVRPRVIKEGRDAYGDWTRILSSAALPTNI